MVHSTPSIGVKRYLFSDLFTAYLSWLLFFVLRKSQIEHVPIDLKLFAQDANFLGGGFMAVYYWIFIYSFSNTYQNIYTKSRLAEIIKTIIQSVAGCLFFSIFIVLDDRVFSYRDYYSLMDIMICTHLIPTLAFRFFWLTKAKMDMKNGNVVFPTMLIGNHPNLEKIYNDILHLKQTQGISVFSIYTDLTLKKQSDEVKIFPFRSWDTDLDAEKFSYAILALAKDQKDSLSDYIRTLDENGLQIKVIPELHDSLTTHQVKINNPLGAPLIDIDTNIMTIGQSIIKRVFDITVSSFALIVLSPFLLIISLLIKKSSPGPILYKQERLGKDERPFTIYKFRSMRVDAEKEGPQLSNSHDDRTTSIGYFMRKYRIDEIPQFINVIKGDMSIVGPRPERKFYAKKIIMRCPEYKYIYKFQPGITSWGMVRFGYATNVDEMIERMEYDLMYVQNFSLLMDIRIILYTIRTIIKGKGV